MKACIDLFCGCGGLSLGAAAAGFEPRVAVDVDSVLTSSYQDNHSYGQVLVEDLFKIKPNEVSERLDQPLGGIFGGPPCQGFSSIGRQDPNDPRNRLLIRFFQFVSELRPTFFLMENVPGLLNDKNQGLLSEGLALLPPEYKVLAPKVLDASKFGAATRRRRVFVVGANTAIIPPFPEGMLDAPEIPETTVRDAIFALPCPGKMDTANFEVDQFGYFLDRLFLPRYSGYRENGVTGFIETIHKEKTVRRFETVAQGQKDQASRYPRLEWSRAAPTLRAGTGSDKGSFQAARPIHPAEPRVISVREAARLQGFPDWFKFHSTKWHSHRMIGNSVSPIVAKFIFEKIYSHIHGFSEALSNKSTPIFDRTGADNTAVMSL